jgi:CheY-like chemotaxis protein
MSKIKVLVIDDDGVVGSLLCEMLCILGYAATFLHNSKSAPVDEVTMRAALIATDLIFTDGQMPGFDGSAVIDLARQLGIDLDRIVVVTGFLDEPLKARIAAFGGVRILAKPCKKEQIQATVESMLASVA